MFKAKRSDNRNACYPYFKYVIQPKKSDNDFFTIRNWCWETFGSSKEIEAWLRDKNPRYSGSTTTPVSHNLQWAWKYGLYSSDIYLATDKEYSFFLLRFS